MRAMPSEALVGAVEDSRMDRFLSRPELLAIGFAHIGEAVSIDRSTIFLNPAGISIGDHTRIDAFGLISGSGTGVKIGRNVHIAAGAYIYGGVELRSLISRGSPRDPSFTRPTTTIPARS
jgi:hypothetical protein